MFGWIPGGMAVVAVLVSAFFTTFTGASGVTILALGGFYHTSLLREVVIIKSLRWVYLLHPAVSVYCFLQVSLLFFMALLLRSVLKICLSAEFFRVYY